MKRLSQKHRILLIHGAAATGRIWRWVAPILQADGFSVCVAERESSGSLRHEIDQLWSRAENSIVLGVSGGATLAWELASRGCDMKAIIAHEPAAGSLVPNLLSGPGSAFAALDNAPGDTTDTTMMLRRAITFGKALYGDCWTERELPADPMAVYHDFQMFAAFEPHQPRIPLQRIHLTLGQLSSNPRYQVAAEYKRHFAVDSLVIPQTRHCVQLEQPQRFAHYVISIARQTLQG